MFTQDMNCLCLIEAETSNFFFRFQKEFVQFEQCRGYVFLSLLAAVRLLYRKASKRKTNSNEKNVHIFITFQYIYVALMDYKENSMGTHSSFLEKEARLPDILGLSGKKKGKRKRAS